MVEDLSGSERARSSVCIRVLGPLDVIDRDGSPVAVGSPKLRRLLAALTIGAGSVVSVDRLADVVWGDEQPEHVGAALQSLVSRLRRCLPDPVSRVRPVELVTRAPGYVLRVADGALDAELFETSLASGRALLEDAPARAARLLDDALDAWRGRAYAEFRDEPFARAEAGRLEELRATAREERVEAALAMGATDEAIARLEVLTADHELRERPQAQLMVALYRAGRQVDALAVFRHYRERLDRELGLEPSAELRELERSVLRGDPQLARPPARDHLQPARPPARDGRGTGREATDARREPPAAHAEPLDVHPEPRAGDGGDRSTPPTKRGLAERAAGALPPAPDLVGRERLGHQVGTAIDTSRVVTLIGPGGVGKTSVALRTANDRRAAFSDGVWWCELASVGIDAAVPELVLSVLDAQAGQHMTVTESLVDLLRNAEALLVLDNAEHVIDGVASLVGALTRGCPDLRVLLTSRERVGLHGEQVVSVPPLAVPPPGLAEDPGGADRGDRSDTVPGHTPAVALFVRRAAAATGGFAVTAANAAAVAEICRRLDGLPLALELAATRMRSMGPTDLADRLSWRFRVLRGGRRDTAGRHRTLRAVVDWSYELLDDDARTVFERLSVFAGEFPLDAAERVVADTDGAVDGRDVVDAGGAVDGRDVVDAGSAVDARDVADLIAGLVDASMVVARQTAGTTSYVLLETLRAYGRERLEARGETHAARRAHARYHADLVAQASAQLYGADNRAAVARLNGVLHELRAAHAWCIDNDLDTGLRLSAGLTVYAEQQAIGEAFLWAERVVEAAERDGDAMDSSWLVGAYGAAAMGARFRGDLARAVELAERGLAVAGDDDQQAYAARYALVEATLFQGRFDEAGRLMDALERADQGVPLGLRLWTMTNRLLSLAYRGDPTAAVRAEQELARAKAAGEPSRVAWAAYILAESLVETDPIRALPLAESALAHARAYDDRFLTGVALVTAASLHARHGEAARSVALFRETITWWHRGGNWMQQWITLRSVVGLLARLGALEDAAVLLGAVRSRTTESSLFGADAQRLADAEVLLRDRLGDAAYVAAVERGAVMPDDDVVGWLRDVLDEHDSEDGGG